MTYAVIACSECSWSWIVEDLDDQQTSECPRCETRYNSDLRSRQFITDDAEEACEIRGAILADQAGHHDRYHEGVDHFADLEDLAHDGVIDDSEFLDELGVEIDENADAPRNASAGRSRTRSAEGPQVDVDVAERPLLRADGADRPDLAQAIQLEPYGTTTDVDATVYRDVSPRSSEWLPDVLEDLIPTAARLVQELAAERAPRALDGYLSLFVREVLLEDIADVDEERTRTHVETHAYMDAIAQYALQFPTDVHDTVVDEDLQYTVGREEIGEQLVDGVETVLTTTGTGRGQFNAGIEALRHGPIALHEQAASPPTVTFILDGPEWTDAANDTIERALQTLHVLAQGLDVHVVASPTVAQLIQRTAQRAIDRAEEPPEWAHSLTDPTDTSHHQPPGGDASEAQHREDAWNLLVDGAHKDGHRAILQNLREDATRTVQDLKHDDAINYGTSTIDRYLSELEELSLIEITRSTTSSNEVSLSALGGAARALVADDGSVRHHRQSRLGEERYANPPRSRKCSVTPQPDKRGTVEPWLADTGDPREDGWVQFLGDAREDRRLQPPAMHDRILAGRRVEGVNLVEDDILDLTDDDQAPNGDGRVVYASAFDEELVLTTQYGGAAATLGRIAAALFSDKLLSKVLCPSNLGTQFEDAFDDVSFSKDVEDVFQRGAQVGWSSDEDLAHIDEWRERIGGVRSELLSTLARLDDLDKGLRREWFKKVHGFLASATAMYRAAGVHVNINLRFPNARELARDDERLDDFLKFMRYTVTKQAGFEDENGWHSIFRNLMEDRPHKLRARLPYEILEGEETAELTTSWILQGRGVHDLQEEIEEALEAERSRVRERVQEGVEDAAVLDIPVVEASTTAHTRQIVREHADRKGFDGADVDELTRVLDAYLGTEERGPVPMNVADVMMALESSNGPRDRMDGESLAVGLSVVPAVKLLPALPPSASRMLKALLAADSSLTRQDLIEITSEKSVERHLEKLVATDLVEVAGSSEYVGYVEPWWSPSVDRENPREDAHETGINGVESRAGVLFEHFSRVGGDVLEAHDWQLLSRPVEIDELVDAFPGWAWFIRYVWSLFDEPRDDESARHVVLGHPSTVRDAAQVTLPQRLR